MKIIKRHIILFLLLIAYFIFGHFTHLYIPCPIHTVFHVYCPGCGVTRMLISIIHLDFVSAFRYNQLLFILLPFGIALYINYIYSVIKKKKAWYQRIPVWVYYLIIILLLIFGVIRNIIPALTPII
jgi:hypothetical protein